MYGELTDKDTIKRLEKVLEEHIQDQFEMLLYKKNSKYFGKYCRLFYSHFFFLLPSLSLSRIGGGSSCTHTITKPNKICSDGGCSYVYTEALHVSSTYSGSTVPLRKHIHPLDWIDLYSICGRDFRVDFRVNFTHNTQVPVTGIGFATLLWYFHMGNSCNFLRSVKWRNWLQFMKAYYMDPDLMS